MTDVIGKQTGSHKFWQRLMADLENLECLWHDSAARRMRMVEFRALGGFFGIRPANDLAIMHYVSSKVLCFTGTFAQESFWIFSFWGGGKNNAEPLAQLCNKSSKLVAILWHNWVICGNNQYVIRNVAKSSLTATDVFVCCSLLWLAWWVQQLGPPHPETAWWVRTLAWTFFLCCALFFVNSPTLIYSSAFAFLSQGSGAFSVLVQKSSWVNEKIGPGTSRWFTLLLSPTVHVHLFTFLWLEVMWHVSHNLNMGVRGSFTNHHQVSDNFKKISCGPTLITCRELLKIFFYLGCCKTSQPRYLVQKIYCW